MGQEIAKARGQSVVEGIGVNFRIGSPPFRVTAAGQKVKQRLPDILVGVYGLVQVAWIAFMGQRGVQRVSRCLI